MLRAAISGQGDLDRFLAILREEYSFRGQKRRSRKERTRARRAGAARGGESDLVIEPILAAPWK